MKNETIRRYQLQSSRNKTDLLPAVLAVIIFTKEFFKSNKELKKFTGICLQIEYKEYLFKSRTLLYSRVIKDFFLDENKKKFLRKQIDHFFDELAPEQSTRNKKNEQDVIEKWSKIINPDD